MVMRVKQVSESRYKLFKLIDVTIRSNPGITIEKLAKDVNRSILDVDRCLSTMEYLGHWHYSEDDNDGLYVFEC